LSFGQLTATSLRLNRSSQFTTSFTFISDTFEELIQILFEKLSTNGGQIMVPLDSYDGEGDYGFGKKFGWCEDRYGVSWQFVLSE